MGVGPRRGVKELVRYEDYFPDVEKAGRGLRWSTWALRVLLMTVFGIVYKTPWRSEGVLFWHGMMLGAGYGAGAGVIGVYVGTILGTSEEAESGAERMERIYANDPSIVADPPTDATHRAVCSAVDLEALRTVPGILYVTPRGLIFQSHIDGWEEEGTRSRPRYRRVELRSASTLVLDHGEVRLQGRWARWRKKDRLPLLICRAEDGEIILNVPERERVTRALQERIDELRSIQAPPRDA